METHETSSPVRQVGRYSIFQQIAAGGMATVHFARFAGPGGFSRVVAIKHLHPHLFGDPEFKSMFIGEARLASRIRHPNVVPTLDVVVSQSDLFLVMEYVQGEALSSLRKMAKAQNQEIPLPVCSAIMIGALQGLHAAHEARNEAGHLLNIIHRDISPPNILIGVDGVPLVLDFGVAKALEVRREDTKPGVLKGKSSYMAPEQIRGEPLTRATDIFAAAVVFWELLTSRRLFAGTTEHERMRKVLAGADMTPPSSFAPRIEAGLDAVVMKGLRPNPADRYATALEMAEAIERLVPPASQRAVGDWVARTAAETLARKAEILKQIEASELSAPASLFETASHGMLSQGTYAGVEVPASAGKPSSSMSWKDRRLVLGGGAGAVALMAIVLAVAGRPGGRPATTAPAAAAPALSAPAATGAPPALGLTTAEAVSPRPSLPSLPPPVAEPALAPEPAAPAAPEGAARGADRDGVKVAVAAVDRAPSRRAVAVRADARGASSASAAHARPVPATARAVAPSLAPAPSAAPPPVVEVAKAPAAPSPDLKKRIRLVDDEARVRILE